MIIYLDMDETLVNLVDPWLDILNEKSGHNFSRDQVGAYAVEDNFSDRLSSEEIFEPFNTEGFWSSLPPFPGALEFVQTLYEADHTIYIATIPALGSVCHHEKEYWVQQYLPFIGREHLIFCHHKYLLRGDALLDDNPKYLAHFRGKRLLFDKPWNSPDALRDEGMLDKWFIRMHSYQSVLDFLAQMELPF
jgi:5'(3')-deoxyribonucleotidase